MNPKIIPVILIYIMLISLNAFSQNKDMSFPFISSIERQDFIKQNYRKIQINQTEQEVKQILGTPDEVLPLYEPIIKKTKNIGFTFWYILQRLKENGSQNEKAEKIVRVTFNLEGKVVSIDQWGLEKK